MREANAELVEIDENLKRRNLTAPEKTKAIARRKVIWKERRESDRGSVTLTGRGNTGFATETAEASGDSKNTINEYLARADKLAPQTAGVRNNRSGLWPSAIAEVMQSLRSGMATSFEGCQETFWHR